MLDLVGPLGHGFPLSGSVEKAVLVGGRDWNAPPSSAGQFYGANATVITGFRNGGAAILQADFEAAGAKTILCTDDGSAGFHGFTTQALERHLEENDCGVIYTCGPKVMMRGWRSWPKRRASPVMCPWRSGWPAASVPVWAVCQTKG